MLRAPGADAGGGEMIRVIVSIAALLLVAGTAEAQDEKGFVSYRHNLMEAIGHDMGAIGDILKNGLPHQKNIAAHARSIADHSRLIAAAFEKNAAGAPHDAKPNVWTDWAGFEKAIGEFQAEADRFAATAAGGDMAKIGAGTQALGKACNSCHETYRKPKEESYKRGKSGH
jgi:cytochrome c556